MLQAVIAASLLDDIDRSDSSTQELEAYVARLAGKEAGLFVPSGTMGNIVSLRTLLHRPPYAILCDANAHIFCNEAGGSFALAGAIPQLVAPANNQYLTLDDILEHVKLTQGTRVHSCPTQVIALENTLRGMVMPLTEARRICEFAHKNGIRIHIDGARLWEVAAAGHGSLSDYCSLADTVTMCFSKGLGAPAGAIVVGSEETIRHARWVRQSIGGSIRQPGLLAAAALTAVQRTFEDGLLPRTHQIAREIAAFWQSRGGKLKHPTHTNIVWLDFCGQNFNLEDLARKAAEQGILISRDRLVVHYQISNAAVEALEMVMDRLLQPTLL